MKAEIIYKGETVTVEWEEPTIVIESSGEQGPKGDKGDTGYAPVRGVDYWTEEDKQIVSTQAEEAAEATAATMLSDPEYKESIKGDPGYTPVKGVDFFDGQDGQDGQPGRDGQDGAPGQDGVSPTITVTDITGGHRVTITDASGAHSFDVMNGEDGAGAVQDVQVNGVSVLQDGVANVPLANNINPGVVKVSATYGTQMFGSNTNCIGIIMASDGDIKSGEASYKAINPGKGGNFSFYGLAKAAGDTTQKSSSNAVGQYTEAAKSAISEMLNGSVSVSGTTPTINALPGIRYVCGEVTTLDIVTPASGIVDVVFTSGSTPTALTVTPPMGVTMKWANGFDPASLEANVIYDVRVTDGEYATVTKWGGSSSDGGELFQLIETITLAEDTNSITRSQTPSGQPYNYHNMIVMINAPAASKAIDAKIIFSGSYAAIYSLTLWSNTINTTKRLSFYSIENIGTNLFRLFRNSGQQWTYSNATCELATNPFASQQDDSIKSVTYGANNNVNMIPAGTVISIYAK